MTYAITVLHEGDPWPLWASIYFYVMIALWFACGLIPHVAVYHRLGAFREVIGVFFFVLEG